MVVLAPYKQMRETHQVGCREPTCTKYTKGAGQHYPCNSFGTSSHRRGGAGNPTLTTRDGEGSEVLDDGTNEEEVKEGEDKNPLEEPSASHLD